MTVNQLPATLRLSILRRRGCMALIGACIVLAGCAPAPINPDAITASPEPGRAVVIGRGNTVAENARAALTPEQGNRVTRLFVAGVNTQGIGLGENIVRLPPGEYDLTISCGIYRYYKFYTDIKMIHATLDANRVYRLRSDLDGIRCEPYLEDVTDKNG